MAPAAASATVVRVKHVHDVLPGSAGGVAGGPEFVDLYTLEVTAAPGERNRVHVRFLSAGRVLVTDPGSHGGLHVAMGCRRRTAATAICTGAPGGGFDDASLATGDGDDTVTASRGARAPKLSVGLGPGRDRSHVTIPASVSGGSGDDVLEGSVLHDQLFGDEGDDRLIGGASRDILLGGPGDDRIDGGPGADDLTGDGGRDDLRGGPGDDRLDATDGARTATADRVDGGPGADVVDYRQRDSSVRIVLGNPGRTSRAGRHEDVLRHVEDAVGGNGDDILVGDAGPNLLSGGPGRNGLYGRGGDDDLTVDAGTVDGGAGDDVIRADVTLLGATAECGAGDDLVQPSPRLLVPPSCERVDGDGRRRPATRPVPVAAGGSLAFAVVCPIISGCQQWRLVLRRAPRGPAWVGDDGVPPGPPAPELASATLPPTPPGGRVIATVTRDPATLPTGRPVVAAVQDTTDIGLPLPDGGRDLVAWGLKLP